MESDARLNLVRDCSARIYSKMNVDLTICQFCENRLVADRCLTPGCPKNTPKRRDKIEKLVVPLTPAT